MVGQLLHPAPAGGQRLDHGARVGLGDVDGQPLHRLAGHAVDLAGDHLRLAHCQLEALAAHQLDQHRQLQLAAALHLPRVGPVGVEHPQRDVADQLAVEPLLEHPGGQLRAAAAGQRRVLVPRVIDSDGSSR